MYRIFFYRVGDESEYELYIEDEEEYETFDEAMRRVAFFEDDDLFEIAKDIPWSDGSFLKTLARPASMCAFINSYYARW